MSERLNLPAERPCILSFTGPDAIRFLNGQITQDVSGLSHRALPACVTNAKGRLQYFIKVFAGPDEASLWVTCPADQSEGLRDRLERYLIADDVEVHELSDQWALVHASQAHDDCAFVRSSTGCFGDGFDCWWEPAKLPQLDSIDDAEAKRRRIAARIPAWGHELNEGLLPPEAGLDQTSISYRKGCYIGQEVLSRLKTAGKLNRRLAAFTIQGAVGEGDRLAIATQEVGQLTSCELPTQDDSPGAALGYLKKQGFEQTEFQVIDSNGNPVGLAAFVGWA